MQLNIEKHNFCPLEGISNIKNHLEKLSDVKIVNSKATGQVDISISYNDFEGLECFKSLPFAFALDLEGLNIIEVNLGKTNVVIIEGQGIEIDYELIINYLPAADKSVEIEVINEDEISINKETEPDLEEIKENISEYYEDKLASNLNRDVEVEISKDKRDVKHFLDFFDTKLSYYKLKCLEVFNEEELENISKEYGVEYEKLLAGYDRENHKVLFDL